MVFMVLAVPMTSSALGSQQNPQNVSVGVEGTIPAPAPTQAATIATPGSGQTFTNIPITVAGLCPNNLLIKIFANNVFVGSVMCSDGSYSLKVDLFSGQNDLVARDYDALDQQGPDSNVVSVTFKDAQFLQFGTRVTLASDYARRGADPGQSLSWPITLSGGTAPYAISADWGDGTAPDLSSQSTAGALNLKHTYISAGTYKIVIKATDAKGTTGFLQLVGVANGQAGSGTAKNTNGGAIVQTKTEVLWWPAAVLLPFILITFWIGRRYELYSIRKHLEDSRQQVL
jgi:hypothetical protein